MNIRCMSLALILIIPATIVCMMDDSGTQPAQSSSSSISSTSRAIISNAMIRLSRDNLTHAHAAAYVKWNKGILPWVKDGECSMIVQTNLEESQIDAFNLLTVPQTITNRMPHEISSRISEMDHTFPSSHLGAKFYKSLLCDAIANINKELIEDASSKGYITTKMQPRITAFVIALAYKGRTYHGGAVWDNQSDTLIPFISPIWIHQERHVISLSISPSTGQPGLSELYKKTKKKRPLKVLGK